MAASITAATQVFMSGVLRDFGVVGTSDLIQNLSVLLLIAGSCLFTCRGLDASVKISLFLSALSIPAVAFVVGMAAWRGGVQLGPQFELSHMAPNDVVKGAMASLSFLIAFEGLSTLAAETAHPTRSIPRLLYLLVGVSGGCAVIAGASPIGLLSGLGGVPWMRFPTDILLLTTGFASMVAVWMYGSRVFATASLDGILPPWLSKVDGAGHAPRRAAVFVSLVAAIALLGPAFTGKSSPVTVGSIYGSAVVTFWLIPYALITLAAIVQEFKRGQIEPLVLASSTLGLAATLFMLERTLSTHDDPGLAWIPWAVFGTALPLAAWLYIRSGTSHVRDF
jgi:amino acid transporter